MSGPGLWSSDVASRSADLADLRVMVPARFGTHLGDGRPLLYGRRIRGGLAFWQIPERPPYSP